jgi:hypothetical protein
MAVTTELFPTWEAVPRIKTLFFSIFTTPSARTLPFYIISTNWQWNFFMECKSSKLVYSEYLPSLYFNYRINTFGFTAGFVYFLQRKFSFPMFLFFNFLFVTFFFLYLFLYLLPLSLVLRFQNRSID